MDHPLLPLIQGPTYSNSPHGGDDVNLTCRSGNLQTANVLDREE